MSLKSSIILSLMISAISELFLFINFFDQLTLIAPWNLHRFVVALGLSAALLLAPMPLLVGRTELKKLNKLFSDSSDGEGSVVLARKSLGNLIVISCFSIETVILALESVIRP